MIYAAVGTLQGQFHTHGAAGEPPGGRAAGVQAQEEAGKAHACFPVLYRVFFFFFSFCFTPPSKDERGSGKTFQLIHLLYH